jgi:hypothetical protein
MVPSRTEIDCTTHTCGCAQQLESLPTPKELFFAEQYEPLHAFSFAMQRAPEVPIGGLA